MIAPEVLDRLKGAVGEGGWSVDPDRLALKLVEWRDRWRGETPLLLLPRTADEVSAIVRICAETGVAITTQGGNTGLVGAQIPQGEILISTERMRAVREVNAEDEAMVVEAGVTLAEAHAAAAAAHRRFPLDLASEGSATIGGLVSTNAGGTAVLRYGMTRELVLGLEAVLPDGSVWNGLKRLRKDNTGYDLKQLLIGAEGTLAVVTAAAVKLFPVFKSRATAFVGLGSVANAGALLRLARAEAGLEIEAFELVKRIGIEFATRNLPGCRDPLEAPHAWYVLIEIASARPGEAEGLMQSVLSAALNAGLVEDAAIAQSEAQAQAFWALREGQSAAQKPEGPAWKHDVSVPLSAIPAFIEKATAELEVHYPGVRVLAFGHMGDGNIHFDALPAVGGDFAAHAARREEGSAVVHDLVRSMGGSISAEHGLGILKTAEAAAHKAPVELAALRAIRQALDPKRIMNPRVLF